MNSRTKGKVGEREFASLLREHGYAARRGQQFAGGGDSPDVVSSALPWLHIEVKRVQNLNLADACAQASGDSGGKPWIVAHRRNHAPWLITMRAELFFRLLRGELPPPPPECGARSAECGIEQKETKDAKDQNTRGQRSEVGGQQNTEHEPRTTRPEFSGAEAAAVLAQIFPKACGVVRPTVPGGAAAPPYQDGRPGGPSLPQTISDPHEANPEEQQQQQT